MEPLHTEPIRLGIIPHESLTADEAQSADPAALVVALVKAHGSEAVSAGAAAQVAVLVVTVRDTERHTRVALEGVEERVGDPPAHRPRRPLQPASLPAPAHNKCGNPTTPPPPPHSHPEAGQRKPPHNRLRNRGSASYARYADPGGRNGRTFAPSKGLGNRCAQAQEREREQGGQICVRAEKQHCEIMQTRWMTTLS